MKIKINNDMYIELKDDKAIVHYIEYINIWYINDDIYDGFRKHREKVFDSYNKALKWCLKHKDKEFVKNITIH